MALNRERILNELGDVMNQLQGAHCGCMEKLFTPSSTQGMQSIPGMGGCCGHPGGHNHNTQPTPAMPALACVPTSASQCLGSCDPAQLYSETHNYLSENLVKPVVQEVYQDLKSLTPENTVANNPLAQQIISANAKSMASNPGAAHGNAGMAMSRGDIMSNPGMGVAAQMGGMAQNQMSGGGQYGMGQAGFPIVSENAQRMGEGWVNMMLGDSKNTQPPVMPDMPPMAKEMMGGGMNPMGSVAAPMAGGTSAGMSQMGSGMPPMLDPNNPNMGQPQNLQVHPQANMAQMAGMAQMPQNMLQTIKQGNPDAHAMKEFNKMFPQIQQGGDLGFDPMALAMQMNPNNQQNSNIDAMHTMAHGLSNNYSTNNNNNSIPVNYDYVTSKVPPSVLGARNGLAPQDQVPYNTWTHHQFHQRGAPQSQGQQNGDQWQQYGGQWQQQAGQPTPYEKRNALQQQYAAAATAAATVIPAAFKNPSAPQQKTKEKIYPVDNANNIRYNTLGQPYELVPENMIHRPNYGLPPPVKPMRFGTVKSTISKTSLMGMKPVGKQPSKSQLQQIYNQYRGSNSYPNLGGGLAPYRERTNMPLVPIENVGDAANVKEVTIKLEQVAGEQAGDGPAANKKPADGDDVLTPLQFFRPRNGLQDALHSSYSSNRSPKWSFHGGTHARPHYTTYRFKPKN